MKNDSTIKEITDKIDQELEELVNKADPELIRINEDIKEKITHFISMSEEMDSRRSNIYNFSMQYLVLLAMLLTLISVSDSVYKYIPIVIVLIQAFLPLKVLIKFNQQAECNYIFKQDALKNYSNKWKWFYYGNEYISKINIKPIDNDTASVKSYLEGLSFIVNSYTEDNLKGDVKNNIQQLYLLQVHNYYKNKFYGELTHIYTFMLRLLIATIVLGVIATIIIA